MQVFGVIKRNFVLNNVEDFRLLFNRFVRPHLEYCVHVLCPYLRKDIDSIDKDQRRATKLVKGLKNKSYEERLQALRITSLEKRRIRGGLIQVFRIVRSYDGVEFEELFELDDGGRHVLRGHNWKLKVKRCRLQVRKCLFTVWNKLQEYVVQSSSVVMFKKRLDDWSMDVEL